MKIGVVIPAHNEEKHIGTLVARIRDLGLDIVVIDDGSLDRTGQIARENGALVLRNEPRGGKGYSLKRGFAHMMAEKYDGLISMDGDGQHDPEDIPLFLKAAEGRAMCLVNGTRMGRSDQMPIVRRVTNRFMSWLISRICGQKIEDTQCGFRYISTDILKRISLESNDFEIETEVLLKSCRAGCRVIDVPVKTIYRDEKSKINPVKDTIRFFSYIWKDSLTRSSVKRNDKQTSHDRT